jgi:hypothetical protein
MKDGDKALAMAAVVGMIAGAITFSDMLHLAVPNAQAETTPTQTGGFDNFML